jgi:TonB family protein
MRPHLVVASAVVVAVLVPRPSAAQDAAKAPVDLRGIWSERGVGKAPRFDAKKAAARGLDPGALELPRRLGRMPVRYSQIEDSPKQSGTVTIGCRLAVSGRPEDCTVTRPLAPLLDEAALGSVASSRYTPLTVNGEPRPALVELKVKFEVFAPYHEPEVATVPPIANPRPDALFTER